MSNSLAIELFHIWSNLGAWQHETPKSFSIRQNVDYQTWLRYLPPDPFPPDSRSKMTKEGFLAITQGFVDAGEWNKFPSMDEYLKQTGYGFRYWDAWSKFAERAGVVDQNSAKCTPSAKSTFLDSRAIDLLTTYQNSSADITPFKFLQDANGNKYQGAVFKTVDVWKKRVESMKQSFPESTCRKRKSRDE